MHSLTEIVDRLTLNNRRASQQTLAHELIMICFPKQTTNDKI